MLTFLTIPKKLKKLTEESKEAADAGEMEQTEEDGPTSVVNHVNILVHSIFSNVEVYINKQQIYNSNGLYAHKFYNSNNFKGSVGEYLGVLHCEVYD